MVSSGVHAMKRKIVQHGSSSLTITLPIKWAEKFGLKKGVELNVEDDGKKLIISADPIAQEKKKVFSATEYGIFTKNNLSHLYQLGYDEIEVFFEDQKTFDEIKERISNCIGYEIIDQKMGKVHIKSIATTLDAEFDTLLRKSFQVTNEMAHSMLEAIEKGNNHHLAEIRRMEDLNNKFTDFCIRILNKKGYANPDRSMQIYEIVKNIERVADEFKYLCDALKDYKGKLDNKMIGFLKETFDYYFDFYEMYYKFNVNLKKRLYLDRKDLNKKYIYELQKSKGVESIILHHLLSIIQKTYDCAGAYFALVL